VGRLAQVLLQDSQGAGDNHPLDATTINGDGNVLAEWFHGEFSPFVSRPPLGKECPKRSGDDWGKG